MTNPFLKAEVEAAIEEIQENIDEIEGCLEEEPPRSLLLAAYLHHQKDVRRIFKNTPRCDIDDTATNRAGKCHMGRYDNHERRATPELRSGCQCRASSPPPAPNDQQAERLVEGTAVCEKCGSTDIRVVGRR